MSTFSKHPLTCLQWLKDSIRLPTLHQADSESVVFMLLAVNTMAEEEVDLLMAEVLVEDVEEDVDEVEEDTYKDVSEGAAAHMKMELTSQMSPVTLKIHSGTHSQTIQGKGSLRTWYAQSSWQIKRGAPPALSVLESTKITG